MLHLGYMHVRAPTIGITLTAIAVFGAVVFWDTSRPVTNWPPKNETIVAFGDSLVEGVGAKEGNDFVSLLSEKLGRPVVNLGTSGDTTRDGLARLDDVLQKDPGLVLLLFGGNDYLRRIEESETRDNLAVIIERLQAEGSAVMLLGVRGGVLRDSRKAMYKDLSREYETLYMENVLDGLLGNPDYMYDTIHPNDRGHRIIADRLYKILTEHE